MEEIENNIQENLEYIKDMLNPSADQEPLNYIEDVLNSMFNYIYAEKDNLENLVDEIKGKE